MLHRTGMTVPIAVLAGCFLLGCPAPETSQPEDMTAMMQAADAEFVAAFDAGDAGALAALYTADGMLLPPNADFVSGTEAIGGFWQAVMDAGVASAELRVEEAQGLGDTAWEVGHYALFDSSGTALDEGKYIVIWKRTEAGWKLHRDIWNSSRAVVTE